MQIPVESYLSDGPNLGTPIEHPEAVGVLYLSRAEHLHESVGACVNARVLKISHDVETLPDWVRKMTRLRRIDVTSYALTSLPSWLDELRDLRHLGLDRAGKLREIPDVVWRLPRLENLWLFHTTFDHLDGIERAPNLRQLIVFSPALAPKLPEIAARLRGAAGVDAVEEASGQLQIRRRATFTVPTGTSEADAEARAELVATLPRGSDVRGLDLRGRTFRDLDVSLDLRGACLDGTTWIRCRFEHVSLDDASAESAIFDHCWFASGTSASRLRAPRVTFRGCSLGLGLSAADLRGAEIVSAPDSSLRLAGADLRGATIDATFSSPQKGSYVVLDGADLRGATLRLRLTEDAAKRVAKSTAPVRWTEASVKDVSRDETTSLTYATLKDAAPPAPAPEPGALAVGTLCGGNAACWFVVADAEVFEAWTGSRMTEDYEELPDTDFSRAMDLEEGPIAIGAGRGVLAQVGDCGCSKLWKLGETWFLLDAREGPDVVRNSKEALELFGDRVAHLPTKRRARLGKFEVKRGAMTLALPYVANPFSNETVARAIETGEIVGVPNDHHALCVPTPNGRYEVTYEALDHADDAGTFHARVRIARVGDAEAKKAPVKTASAKKVPAKVPAKKVPAKKAPAKKAPAKKAAAKKAAAKTVPAKKAAAKTVPAKNAPAKKAPAKKTPAKKAPAKKTPAKKMPAKKMPAKKMPAKKMPAKKAAGKKAAGKKLRRA
jgi:uncharacterized protein YjbI with pentapeptide repeats